MIDYVTPLEEILFSIRHAAKADRLPGWDDELVSAVLTEAGRLVDEVVAPLDPIGDTKPARLEGGRVRMPEAFVSAYSIYREAGWPGLSVEERYGGQGLPHVLSSCISEMLSGACISFQMVLSLGEAAKRTLLAHGSEQQKEVWLPRLVSGEWLATMCLTEPQAGSDLGLVRCMAVSDGDGWKITGSKIFISGGDQDMTGRQLHLVLARTPGAPAGTKGLALFLCPSEFDDGSRNAVSVLRLEEKMGMHASPTCQLAFDNARAEIIGKPGEGLSRMFTMMNAERLDVAVQGVGLAEVAAQRARTYAWQRHQGRAASVTGSTGGDPIVAHGDIRRMLMTQMALVHGIRGTVLHTLVELELGQNPALVSFMTPVCKAFASDAAVESAQLAIQVHGGYGYLREYRVEQVLRDARVTQIYEGTNGIQGLTLAGRLLHLDHGECAQAFHAHVSDSVTLAEASDLPATALALTRALNAWDHAARAVAQQADIGCTSAPFLRLSGLIALGATWARLEGAANEAPSPARIRALAEFVREWMLPESAHLASLCMSGYALGRNLSADVFS